MKKSEFLRALQIEIRRHSFDVFVENPPVMAEGGNSCDYSASQGPRPDLMKL
jgi:hypothetical protein